MWFWIDCHFYSTSDCFTRNSSVEGCRWGSWERNEITKFSKQVARWRNRSSDKLGRAVVGETTKIISVFTHVPKWTTIQEAIEYSFRRTNRSFEATDCDICGGFQHWEAGKGEIVSRSEEIECEIAGGTKWSGRVQTTGTRMSHMSHKFSRRLHVVYLSQFSPTYSPLGRNTMLCFLMVCQLSMLITL